MRANLLPEMTGMLLVDKDGNEVSVNVKLFKQNGITYVFIADKDGPEASSVARNAALFILQLLEQLNLESESTEFFRHIYTPTTGSLFGRFGVVWQGSKLQSYTFTILNRMDEERFVHSLVANAKSVCLKYSPMRQVAAAV